MAKSTKKTSTQKTASKSKKKTNSRLDHLKEVLQQEREELLQEQGNQHNLTEISGHGDLVDQSNDFNEREQLLGLAEHDRERLMAINDALQKIEQGTYGICAMCGSEIPEARLLAVPTAKYCLDCQSKVESQGME